MPKFEKLISDAPEDQKKYLNSVREGIETERGRLNNDLNDIRNKPKKGSKRKDSALNNENKKEGSKLVDQYGNQIGENKKDGPGLVDQYGNQIR